MVDFLDTQQAAKILRQSVRTLQRWRWQGRGPSYSRIGRRILYSPQSIADYFAKCSQNKHDAQELDKRAEWARENQNKSSQFRYC